MSQNSNTILNLTDSYKRYPKLINIIGAYDYVLSYDADQEINKYSKKPFFFFPGTYNQNTYFDLNNKDKKIDISFVGNMYGFRKDILERLSIDFPNLKMRFYGVYQPCKHIIAFLKFLLSRKKRFFKNKNISPKKVNKLYNRSKIVLNFEHPQAERGWSSRLVEILGSGAFQIVSHKDILDYYFKGGLVSFKTYEELISMIKLYLDNQALRNSIKAEGHKKVFSHYTNYFQLKKIFNEIEASHGSNQSQDRT